VVVSIAMGNMPDSVPKLPSLSAPADADSVLAVGITNTRRLRCDYSCTGPTADGRVKPDVVSMGIGNCTVAVANPGRAEAAVANFAGTSFASPAVAGIALLLRQLRPQATAEEVRQALIRTADSYDAPDGEEGYGLVDAAAAARFLGLPILSPLVRKSLKPLYHAGDGSPITLGWDPEKPVPALQLISPIGRLVPITVEAEGPLLRIRPKGHLQTGIYFARVP
jgi:serine protease AprX